MFRFAETGKNDNVIQKVQNLVYSINQKKLSDLVLESIHITFVQIVFSPILTAESKNPGYPSDISTSEVK